MQLLGIPRMLQLLWYLHVFDPGGYLDARIGYTADMAFHHPWVWV